MNGPAGGTDGKSMTRRVGSPLARLAFLTALAASVLAFAAPAQATVRLMSADTLETAVVKRINEVRAAHGLRKLRVSYRLSRAGTWHAESMAKRGFFSHDWYTGAPYSRWIRWFYPGPGYSSWQAGENLFWAAPDTRARRVVRAWMQSPGHRANILRPGWRHIGVGAKRARSPIGVFAGTGTIVVVAAEFGRRS